jgi:hypothetical protein
MVSTNSEPRKPFSQLGSAQHGATFGKDRLNFDGNPLRQQHEQNFNHQLSILTSALFLLFFQYAKYYLATTIFHVTARGRQA